MTQAGAGGGGGGSPVYNYDAAGYDVQLTDDRSQNAARPLAGYPLRASPDPDWPGLDAGGEVRYHPETMKQVAAWLTQQAQQSQSLPGWLARSTSVSFGPSSWHEANNLKDASDQVGQAVSDYLTKVVENLNRAAGSITAAVDTYTTSEDSSARAASTVNSRLPDAGSPGPTVY